MQTLTTRRSGITCLIILVLAAAAVVGLDSFGKGSRVYGTSGTLQDKKVVKKLVDDPVGAYRVWKGGGFRGRTVVFLADRWESFDPGELIPGRMYRAYPLELYNTARLLEEEHLDATTFLYVASMNKVIRKIVAVVPESEVDRMKQLAPKVKDSRVSRDGVFLSRQGFPRWYTTAANFAGDSEPALLYVGASYFRSAEPEELYRRLSSAGLRTDCVVLCYERGKTTVTPNETAKLERFAGLLGMTIPAAAPAGSALPRPQLPAPPGTQQQSAPAL